MQAVRDYSPSDLDTPVGPPTRPIRLYSDISHYRPEHRDELSTFLRPFWKARAFDDDEREAVYGLTSRDFEVVTDAHRADLAVLPMTWNYYVRARQTAMADR